MGFVFTGSIALNDLGYFDLRREPKDIDVIADFETGVRWLKSRGYKVIYPINRGKTLVGKQGIADNEIGEVSIAWPGSTNAELLDYLGERNFLRLNEIYTLKMSHRFLRNSPHFEKTRNDILKMRKHDAQIPEVLWDWFKRREKETYDYSHPSLAQSKQNFFSGDGVNYKYDHDSLHQAVAIFENTPMYKRYQKNGSEVQCDREKWNQLGDVYKQFAVAEEAAVLALERSLIPYPGKMTQIGAFKFALQKICTSITSGWFREYAWENYDKVLQLAQDNDYDFYGKFQQGLLDGTVKEV
jgi:hypothetical protein